MIAQELEVSLHMAFVEARQQRHEFITVEHLLLALLDNPSAAEVLRACSANMDDLRKSLAGFIKENTPTVGGTEEVDNQPKLGFQRVIQRSIMHVQDRALDHALEAQCRLRIHFLAGEYRRVFGDEITQQLAQLVNIDGAGAQHLRRRGIVKQRQQQMLHGDEFMAFLAGLHKRHVQADFEFLGNHAASIMHCNGWPPRRAAASTSSTLVAATSLV